MAEVDMAEVIYRYGEEVLGVIGNTGGQGIRDPGET